jgi:predicted negative regulator of RcsB-dependent stress response
LKVVLAFTVVVIGLNYITRNKSISTSKSNTDLGKALISVENKDYDDAKFQFQRIIDDFPKSENTNLANYYIGKILHEQESFERSKSHLGFYLDNKSNDLLTQSAVLMMSDIYFRENNFKESMSWLTKYSISKSTSYHKNMILIQKAKVLYKLGDDKLFREIVNSILEKKDLTSRQQLLAEELFSFVKG